LVKKTRSFGKRTNRILKMKTILSEKLPRILKNKKKLEKILNVKITNRGKEVSISGNPEEEYVAEKVIDALNFGFPFKHAISIKTEDFIFEIINIKEHTSKKNLESVRGRLIGKQGKNLKTFYQLTKCFFELKDNEVGIIGNPESIENAQEAVIALTKGSKHANVYSFIKRNQIEPILDLGLKKKE
jgi:ribosomal RNA assembly protein